MNVEQRKDALKFLLGVEGTLYCRQQGLTGLDWPRRKVCNWTKRYTVTKLTHM